MQEAGGSKHSIASAMLLMACASSMFPVSDVIAKYLVRDYHPLQVTWARYLFQFVILAIALGGPRIFQRFATRQLKLQLLRGILTVLATILFITALKTTPVVDGITLLFTSPLFVVALSVPFLGERVGFHRWAAVLVGFTGVVLVLRPGEGIIQWGAFLALGSAACVGVFHIVTRILSRTDHPITTLLYMALTGFLILSAAVPFFWTEPTLEAWVLFALAGLISGFAHYGVITAIRWAPLSAVAPFTYAQIMSATMMGYLVFGDIPGEWTIAGLAIIIGSGLYVLHRERRIASKAAAQ